MVIYAQLSNAALKQNLEVASGTLGLLLYDHADNTRHRVTKPYLLHSGLG